MVGMAVVAAVAPLAVAWSTKLVLDRLVAGADLATLVWLACCLAVAGILAAVVPQMSRFLSTEMTRRIELVGMDRLFGSVDRFVGLGRFEDPEFHDRLRLARDSGRAAPSDLVQSMIGFGQGLVTGLGFIGSLATLSRPMTAVVLATAVPAVYAERTLARRQASMLWGISPAIRREIFYSMLLGEVRAAKEVRIFGIGGHLRQRMLAERRSANVAQRRLDLRKLRVQGTLAGLLALVAGAGLVWAITAARGGELTVGDVAMFIAAVAGAQGAVSQVVSHYALARQSMLMFDHYLAVVKVGPDLHVVGAPVEPSALHSGIEFRDVWFRYTPDHPWVLRGVTFTIPHARATALVGSNGAGKSTIIKLLCRFYDPTKGAILWDGVDLRSMEPADLRARIGAVFQDFMEYDLTAAENIGLGHAAVMADRSKLEAAARLAGVHETLARLPHSYDTLLSRMFQPAGSEGQSSEEDARVGVALSTGQWQRLALARALLDDGQDLLILDEPSSGLDAEAEYEIHTMLRARRAGRTSLLISHRLGAIRDADRILVLGDGEILEEGEHAELMALNGLYARLFTLQAQGYRDDTAVATGSSD
ncbi:ABC transporter ATP-binding protein [Actinomadura barringtoniae]|uniref:ABC transporter ATP-binding protein n=2 Tax=Actinomadura barringtoniae TaxID=1427535 RepID=A0A939T7J0_9ACTN|nr:ABC transporter ATP-binding protein [Actinomadura barringtoniae]